MWKKALSILLIFIGVTMLTYNSYWLYKGISASSTPKISVSNFQTQTIAVRKKAVPRKHPQLGEEIGILTIPKLNRSLPIYEGTTSDILKQGVGHIEKTVLPGEQNNSVLSGHRDTVFRGLGEVGVNDELIVETEYGQFLYKIKKVRIVEQFDCTVIVPKPKSTLTLTTCYPFGFIGDAPQRYIVVADLISQK